MLLMWSRRSNSRLPCTSGGTWARRVVERRELSWSREAKSEIMRADSLPSASAAGRGRMTQLVTHETKRPAKAGGTVNEAAKGGRGTKS